MKVRSLRLLFVIAIFFVIQLLLAPQVQAANVNKTKDWTPIECGTNVDGSDNPVSKVCLGKRNNVEQFVVVVNVQVEPDETKEYVYSVVSLKRIFDNSPNVLSAVIQSDEGLQSRMQFTVEHHEQGRFNILEIAGLTPDTDLFVIAGDFHPVETLH